MVVIHGATAVPQNFYRRFAEFLRNKGWTVLTYDFRGVGKSRPESLVGFEARNSDWGLLDMPATLDWVHDTLQPKRTYFVGHSAGGQQAGLLPEPHRVDAMAALSSQSGFWGVQGGWEKINVLFVVTVLMPLLSHLFGYFPWGKFQAGEDLPKGVALQWSRWCRSRKYLLDDKSLPLERYENFTAPILAYSVDDDKWGTPRAVDEMMSAYPNVERRHLVPADHGLKKIGHMGFFRRGSEKLWEEVYEWLKRQ